MKEFSWSVPGKPVNEEQIRELERKIGYRLPGDVVEFGMLNSGAINPEVREFEVADRSGSSFISCFGSLLEFWGDGAESIIGVLVNLLVDEQVPSGVIPFISTGDGDYVCLDYRNGRIPTLVYFSHEINGVEALLPLANSFTDFLEKLSPPAHYPELDF